jgi:hypothetical protein
MRAIVVLIALLALGCAAPSRELGWLVPRASVGFLVSATDHGTGGGAHVLFAVPLDHHRAALRPRRAPAERGRLRLLGEGPPCRVAMACVLERRARTDATGDLEIWEEEP